MILAGDIGGTKTLLGLFDADAAKPVSEKRYASRDHADFASLLRDFLGEAGAAGRIARACLAVAGPVEGNRCKLTYLPWIIDGDALAQEFGLGRVAVVNDFEAAARGIGLLAPEDLVSLQAGAPEKEGTRVVIGAGTGLGVAALLPGGGSWRVVAGEGGHVGFAPADEEQIELWRFLDGAAAQISAERVLSGPGLASIYRFVCAKYGGADTPDPLRSPDPAAAIGARGLADRRSPAGRALDIFARIYGAFAGDLALLFMARGGVYLAGGIAPKILPCLRAGEFLAAFHRKAEHGRLMPGFPIHVVTQSRLGLIGAAQIAEG